MIIKGEAMGCSLTSLQDQPWNNFTCWNNFLLSSGWSRPVIFGEKPRKTSSLSFSLSSPDVVIKATRIFLFLLLLLAIGALQVALGSFSCASLPHDLWSRKPRFTGISPWSNIDSETETIYDGRPRPTEIFSHTNAQSASFVSHRLPLSRCSLRERQRMDRRPTSVSGKNSSAPTKGTHSSNANDLQV